MPYIVFSDLDGTLLDHHSYRHDAAMPALALLKKRGIPLILASSKTACEIAPLRRAFGFAHCPAIVENGAGILAAQTNRIEDQDEKNTGGKILYGELCRQLNELPQNLRAQFTGFGDWSVEEVAEHTGLSLADARCAKDRAFSEPGIWTGTDSDLERFEARLDDKGIEVIRGGRFITLSFGGNKADRMREIISSFEQSGEKLRSIALGDAPNDIGMLLTADIGIVIDNPATKPLTALPGEAEGAIMRSSKPGPEGWCEMVMAIIDPPE